MNLRTIMHKTATATVFAASLVFASACAHHDATADNDFGHVAQNEPAQAVSNNGVTPIPGPAKVDSSGNVYTSSSAPGSGNASGIGTNTNVNVIPAKSSSSDVTYTTAEAAPAPVVVETPAATSVTTVETTTPEPAPVAMTSSTETVATPEPVHHRRMRKD